jgi:hypothetical protein
MLKINKIQRLAGINRLWRENTKVNTENNDREGLILDFDTLSR